VLRAKVSVLRRKKAGKVSELGRDKVSACQDVTRQGKCE